MLHKMELFAVTTKRDFHEKKVARFLKGYGVCGQGLWRKECQVLKTGKRFENGMYFFF